MAVNTKRVEEVTTAIMDRNCISSVRDTIRYELAKQPEFQTQEWIKCSERMPERGATIYCCFKHKHDQRVIAMTVDDPEPCQQDDLWMPRQVPAPPVEEESACVKALRLNLRTCVDHCAISAYENAIHIVKKYEKSSSACA